jgi:hypothetical protein
MHVTRVMGNLPVCEASGGPLAQAAQSSRYNRHRTISATKYHPTSNPNRFPKAFINQVNQLSKPAEQQQLPMYNGHPSPMLALLQQRCCSLLQPGRRDWNPAASRTYLHRPLAAQCVVAGSTLESTPSNKIECHKRHTDTYQCS